MKQTLLFLLLMTTTLFGQSLEEKVKRITSLTKMEFSSANLEQQRDAELRVLQNIVKDEYETQAEFEKRKSESGAKAKSVRAEYARRIAESKKIFEKRKIEMRSELQSLLAQTLEDVESHFTLETDDAEKKAFPIKLDLSQQNSSVKVTRELARDFKNRSSSLVAKGQKQLSEDMK